MGSGDLLLMTYVVLTSASLHLLCSHAERKRIERKIDRIAKSIGEK